MRDLSRYLEAIFRESQIEAEVEAKARARPAITISREAGAGAVPIARRLAEILEKETREKWVVLDRELAAEVVKAHNLPATVAEYMVEAKRREATDWVAEFLGLHPPLWTLVEKINETIRRLTNAGNVIIVGRGAHCVTSHFRNAFHARLVCPLDSRVERAAELYGVAMTEARRMVENRDRERRDYVRQNFSRDVDNPLDYHLVINTGRFSDDEVALLIVAAMSKRMRRK